MMTVELCALQEDKEVMVSLLGFDCKFLIPSGHTLILYEDEQGVLSVEIRKTLIEEEFTDIELPTDFEAPTEHMEISEDDIFHQLTLLRNRLSKEHGVPPYVIFQDKTLREMAQRLPKDLEELRTINGIGTAKLEKYGTEFLEVIYTFIPEMEVTP